MRFEPPFRQPAVMLFHLDGGFTRVQLLHVAGCWEIPTACIPPALRPIGSRLLVVMPRFSVEAHDTPETIRLWLESCEVGPLAPEDELPEP